MARVLGVELIVLLALGFSFGALFFMYWSTKRELLALHADNERLTKRMLETSSRVDTFKYNKNLMESDLEELRRGEGAKAVKRASLKQRVDELQRQLVSWLV